MYYGQVSFILLWDWPTYFGDKLKIQNLLHRMDVKQYFFFQAPSFLEFFLIACLHPRGKRLPKGKGLYARYLLGDSEDILIF